MYLAVGHSTGLSESMYLWGEDYSFAIKAIIAACGLQTSEMIKPRCAETSAGKTIRMK